MDVCISPSKFGQTSVFCYVVHFPVDLFLAIMGVMIEYIPRFIMYYYAWKLMERSELVMKIVEVPCFVGLAARKSAHLVACTYINSLEKTFDLIINKYM